MKNIETPLQRLTRAYQNEARLLATARDSLASFRALDDIAAVGHELENAVRDFLQRQLPNKYVVGHGHVVDSMLRESPHLDVIVADGNSGPILAESANGTRHFPYESVYLIGGVSASYAKALHPISAFTRAFRAIKEDLQRQPTPANYIGKGMSSGEALDVAGTEPSRNPLFSFMIFLDSGDVSIEALLEEYSNVPEQYLPNVVCFADGSFVTKFNVASDEGGHCVGAMHSNCHHILQRDDLFWIWTTLLDPELRGGQVLSVLMMAIFDHLGGCVLLDPPMRDYLYHIFEAASNDPQTIDARLVLELAKSEGKPLPPASENAVEERRKRLRDHYDELVDASKRRTEDGPADASNTGGQ